MVGKCQHFTSAVEKYFVDEAKAAAEDYAIQMVSTGTASNPWGRRALCDRL